MQPRGRASDPNSSTFEVLFGENPSGKGTPRYLDLGQSFQFYALLLQISLGYLPYASICGPGRVHKRHVIACKAHRTGDWFDYKTLNLRHWISQRKCWIRRALYFRNSTVLLSTSTIVNKQEIAVNLTDALIPVGVRNHFRSQWRFERGVTHWSAGNEKKIQPTLEYFESINPGLRIEKS